MEEIKGSIEKAENQTDEIEDKVEKKHSKQNKN